MQISYWPFENGHKGATFRVNYGPVRGRYSKELSKDIVEISGVKGYKDTNTYKVSINYFNGYKASGQLTVSGPNALEKAKK